MVIANPAASRVASSMSADAPSSAAPIPVLRACLPSAERLLPYLRRIDAQRIYSNFGPLAVEFEARLAQQLGLSASMVTSAGSGTAALVAAILASAGRATRERPFALVPSYTFVATAVAVEQCGYTPLLVDVDPSSWMLAPARLLAHPQLDRVGIVVPVSAYGRPVPQEAWQQFRAATGIPVAIDAAAGFDRLVSEQADDMIGPLPIALSFHATKSFGIGEGGAVIATDPSCVARAARALNFGFYGSRASHGPSINGKLSEYHAAVGLAEFDGWSAKLAGFAAVADRYREGFDAAGMLDRLHVSPEVSAAYVLMACRDRHEATAVRRALRADAIDCRDWYGRGLHRQPVYRALPRQPLEVTRVLASCLIGLPCSPDLPSTDIERVVRAVHRAVDPAADDMA
jgi:dTDP-4-amino-4,6-dideoxygalactose transaminase